MIIIFLRAYLSFVHLLWWHVCSNHLSFLKKNSVYLLNIELSKSFMYSGYQSFSRYASKTFSTSICLSFHFLNSYFLNEKIFIFRTLLDLQEKWAPLISSLHESPWTLVGMAQSFSEETIGELTLIKVSIPVHETPYISLGMSAGDKTSGDISEPTPDKPPTLLSGTFY